MVRWVDRAEERVKARVDGWWIDGGAEGMRTRIEGGVDAWVSHARVPC